LKRLVDNIKRAPNSNTIGVYQCKSAEHRDWWVGRWVRCTSRPVGSNEASPPWM